jgi:hypothetical protein
MSHRSSTDQQGPPPNSSLRLADLSRLAAQLDGVSERSREGLLDWRYRGRLVARQLDEDHVVIRATFEFRDLLQHSFPETFSVSRRFADHMMIVADLENGDLDAIEDAVIGAWELQSGRQPKHKRPAH